MLSIRKEIVRFSSVVSTLPGRLDELGLKALACTKKKTIPRIIKEKITILNQLGLKEKRVQLLMTSLLVFHFVKEICFSGLC